MIIYEIREEADDESQSKRHVMMMNYDGHINLAPD